MAEEVLEEIVAFEPEYMQMSILTAALQELTPRESNHQTYGKGRDEDPDRAIIDWLDYAKLIGVDNIQLSSALHPDVAPISADEMLDPVANHLDLRKPFTAERAQRVADAVKRTGIGITEIGYFDDMICADDKLRKQRHDHMYRVIDTAILLKEKGVKVDAIVGFVGRNQDLDMDENLTFFEEQFIPILQKCKDAGLVYRVEQCPMPGWNTTDTWINNIAHVADMWIKLYDIAAKHGVGDQFRITYDASHALLQGQRTVQLFKYLHDKGYAFLIDAFHAKGQVIDEEVLAAHGYQGQQTGRGDRADGKPSSDPIARLGAWAKMGHATHELPGTAVHDTYAMAQNLQEDWMLHQLAARKYLPHLKPENTQFVIEHEYGDARIQDKDRLLPILQGSVAFMRATDMAAANQVALHKSMEAQGIAVQRANYSLAADLLMDKSAPGPGPTAR